MKKATVKRLEEAGWAVGNASAFLGLSHEEEAAVETSLVSDAEVRKSRKRAKPTQVALAKRLGSSRSRRS